MSDTLTGAEVEALRARSLTRMHKPQTRMSVAEQAAARGLPTARFEPPMGVPVRGVPYVLAGERVWAFDPVDDRIYQAAVRGQWYRAEYAEQLGLAGEPHVLSWAPAG